MHHFDMKEHRQGSHHVRTVYCKTDCLTRLIAIVSISAGLNVHMRSLEDEASLLLYWFTYEIKR